MVALALPSPGRIHGCRLLIGADDFDAANGENRELAESVSRALRATGYPLLRKLRVSAGIASVTIRGWLPSYFLKQVALAAALQVPGVEQLRDEVEIASSPDQ